MLPKSVKTLYLKYWLMQQHFDLTGMYHDDALADALDHDSSNFTEDSSVSSSPIYASSSGQCSINTVIWISRFLELPNELHLVIFSYLEVKDLVRLSGTCRQIRALVGHHASALAQPLQQKQRERLQGWMEYWLTYNKRDVDFLEALSRFVWRCRIITDLDIMLTVTSRFTQYWLNSFPTYRSLAAQDAETGGQAATIVSRLTSRIAWKLFRLYIGFHFANQGFAYHNTGQIAARQWQPDMSRFLASCTRKALPEQYGIDAQSLKLWYNSIRYDCKANTMPMVISNALELVDSTLVLTTWKPCTNASQSTQRTGDPDFFRMWDVPAMPLGSQCEFAYCVKTTWARYEVNKMRSGEEIHPLRMTAVLEEMYLR